MNTFISILAISYAIANKSLQWSGLEDYLTRNKKTKTFSKLILSILILIIIFIIIIFLLILIVPFAIFKFFLTIYLKNIHGEDFGGFLNGIGTSFVIQNEQTALTSILFVDYDDNFEDFYKQFKENVKQTTQDFDQLQSFVKNAYGYYYLLKNQVCLDEIYSKISLNNEKTLSLETILNYIDKIRVYDYKEKLFEVIFLNQPVWLNDKKFYAILLKTNHCILDGVSFLGVITKHLSTINKNVLVKNVDLLKKYKNLKIDLNNCYLTENSFGFNEINDLKGNEKQFSGYFIEDQPDVNEKIKLIARKLTVRYSHIILAGLIYSISNLLDKKNIKSGTIKVSITGSADIKQVENIMNGDTESMKTLKNNFFVTQVTLSRCLNQTAKEFLIETCGKLENANKSVTPIINRLFCCYLTSFLPPFLWKKFLLRQTDCTALIFTNLLDHPDEKTVCGRKLYGLFTIANSISNKSIFFATGSYVNRLVMNISGRYEFIKSHDDVQFILDGNKKCIQDIFDDLFQD